MSSAIVSLSLKAFPGGYVTAWIAIAFTSRNFDRVLLESLASDRQIARPDERKEEGFARAPSSDSFRATGNVLPLCSGVPA